jgi:lipopolysaccharide transport system permease protein
MTLVGNAVGLDRAAPTAVDGLPRRPSVVIEPPRSWSLLDLPELWRYRELLYFLVWRDVKVRYKQTLIGAIWAVLQPLLTMFGFSIIFGRLLGVSSDGAPYPLFAFAALLPWTFFATAVARSGTSLVADANLISKVYFPRVIVPVSAVLGIGLDAGIAFAVLTALLLLYGVLPGATLLLLPVIILLLVVTTLGVGLWLAALNVKYRDVAHAIPFLMQFWLFATPVAYSSRIVPGAWQALYALNPMVGVVEGFRWSLLGTTGLPLQLVLISAAVALVLFGSALVFFQRAENEFADVV